LKRIIFVASSEADRNIRIVKEARALKRAGYRVSVLYWRRENKKKVLDDDTEIFCDEEICFTFQAPTGNNIMIVYFPIWWSFVVYKLLTNRWDIVHGLNIFSIIPCIVAAKIKRKTIIYEIIDILEANQNRVIKLTAQSLNNKFLRLAKGVIVVDEEQIEGMGGIPNSNIVVIYDSPPENYYKQNISERDNNNKRDLIMFYAGALFRERHLNIDKVIEAIKEIDGVKLVIAGYGNLVAEIEELSKQMPKTIEFIGKISYEQVIHKGSTSDLFFILRESYLPSHKYICGSTLFNAMICGKPILSNMGTSTAKKVVEENCGIIVNPDNILEIRNAIIKLRDNPELCRKLGENARKAYEQKYSWRIMEQRLVNFYNQMMFKNKISLHEKQ
jgi:glycosyltransferase involved in cell wall biosynthesis